MAAASKKDRGSRLSSEPRYLLRTMATMAGFWNSGPSLTLGQVSENAGYCKMRDETLRCEDLDYGDLIDKRPLLVTFLASNPKFDHVASSLVNSLRLKRSTCPSRKHSA